MVSLLFTITFLRGKIASWPNFIEPLNGEQTVLLNAAKI